MFWEPTCGRNNIKRLLSGRRVIVSPMYEKILIFCDSNLFLTKIMDYFMLSGRISKTIRENTFRSYTGTTRENTDFHVFVA